MPTFLLLVIHLRLLKKLDCRLCYSKTSSFCSVQKRQMHSPTQFDYVFSLFRRLFFFLLSLFPLCSPCCASPCASRRKTMMIVDLIQNTNRKSTIYLTSIIFSFSSFPLSFPLYFAQTFSNEKRKFASI